MHSTLPLLTLALPLVFLAGCGQPSEPAADSNASASAAHERVFQVKGVVMEVKPDAKSVTIKHEEIPGYMPAMTMPFAVKDPNVLAGVQPGDEVSFRMIVTKDDGWIDQLRTTGRKSGTLSASAHPDADPLLKVGDLLPEHRFVNQFGESFSTSQFRGQALAINFLFTRCPFPTFCPLTAHNFAVAQQRLSADVDSPTNWHLLTISFDPEFDTPPVLKAYAESHAYNPARWTFATGKPGDIAAIAEPFGQAFWHDESGGISHNLRTVVIDASGRVQKIFKGNEWKPEELMAEIRSAAAKQ